MRFAAIGLLLLLGSCANFIRESDAVVLDAVPGTIEVGLDQTPRIDGAIVSGKVRFLCQKRLYTVTNVYETAYGVEHELYEVPIGLVLFIPSAIFYGVSETTHGRRCRRRALDKSSRLDRCRIESVPERGKRHVPRALPTAPQEGLEAAARRLLGRAFRRHRPPTRVPHGAF